MFGMIIQRCFHVGKATMNVTKTSVLAQLRKSTGYPLTNCKKALEIYPGDIAKAEEWLHAEAKSKGWSKWAKIQARTATQGLIGVCSRENACVVVEINCETDFVSRNAEFQQLIEKMLSGCVNYATNLKLEEDVTKVVLEESQLGAVQCETTTLGELVIAATNKFNEKTVAKRAVCLKVQNNISLNCVSHPAFLCPNLKGASLGKYGVLLASKEQETVTAEDTAALKLKLCQHIIGMNPLSIGELTDKDIAKFSAKSSSLEDSENVDDGQGISNTENVQSERNSENVQAERNSENVQAERNSENVQAERNSENVQAERNSENVQAEQNSENVQAEQNAENVQAEQNTQAENVEGSEGLQTEDHETMDSGIKETNETQLLFQPYLMEPEVTVGETLYKSGIEVLAFERFECGETAKESPDVAVSASA